MDGNGVKMRIGGGPHRTAEDWLWGGLGVGVASVSTTFAAYMLAFGPAQPYLRGTSDFGVFAHLAPRSRPAEPTDPSPTRRFAASARSPEVTRPDPDLGAGVDTMPTGAVTAVSPSEEPQARAADSPFAPTSLPAFILRDVVDGKALVESHNEMSLVAAGSTLEGAGKVLSVERRGDRWVVTTARGVISRQVR